MRNKFVIIMIEAMFLSTAALMIIKKVLGDNENWLFAAAAAVAIVILLIMVQGYYYIIKPCEAKVKQLEESAEESKEADMIRREFVANVSHELKTPLTSILGFIETLQDGAAEDPEIRHKFIDIIAIETARLKRLIEDLLVLSDIENRRDSEGREFDIKAALESTVETLRPIAQAKPVEIIEEIEEGLTIKGSADRFKQMMLNLIENAVKYSDEGGRVWVKCISSGSRITISVRDEGMGISPEHHERLFERFYRVDKSRSKKAGGTGLGLSIVKHIAVLFGATLRVESREGEGAEFFVVFDEEKEMKE